MLIKFEDASYETGAHDLVTRRLGVRPMVWARKDQTEAPDIRIWAREDQIEARCFLPNRSALFSESAVSALTLGEMHRHPMCSIP